MRRIRRLFLLAILIIVGAVGSRYWFQRAEQIAAAPPPPVSLPLNTQAQSRDWIYNYSVDQRPVVEVRARDMRHVREPDVLQLDHVQLRLFRKDGKQYDHVKSASAVFDRPAGALVSEGDVEITLGVPVEGAQPGRARLLTIRSSGIRFEEKTGKASTDKPASFRFDRGEGSSRGAEYDPATRALVMRSQVKLRWGANGDARAMDVEAGELTYHESESKIFLRRGARLRRGAMTLESTDAVVTLEDGEIRLVEARQASGADAQPGRRVSYGAENLVLTFAAKGAVEKISGEGKARLSAVSSASTTSMEAGRLDMEFETASDDSLLRRAVANGAARLDSTPAARSGSVAPPAKVLRSEVLELIMRPGGEELDRIDTHAAGTLEFVPSHPSQQKRVVEGERMKIQYARDNRLESFRTVNCRTRTENPPLAGSKPAPPSLTSSRDLMAEFDPRTGEISRLTQWGDFRYQEGDRRATSESAVLDSARGLVHLEKAARVSDPAGSIAADRIVLDRQSGDYTADGRVSSTRVPDRKGASTAMLSREEPMQATSARMVSTEQNRRIVYEGDAVVWQGANRLQADKIEIDRTRQVVRADGRVFSQFMDRRSTGTGKKPAQFITVRSPGLVYEEKSRVAHYNGGVVMRRGPLEVRGREIHAWLKEAKDNSDSSLERAVAEGEVRIVQVERGRSRRSASEHAEYFAADERVVLSGGQPVFEDSVKGTTRAPRQLTWFANNDRLLVEGTETQPAVSKIIK